MRPEFGAGHTVQKATTTHEKNVFGFQVVIIKYEKRRHATFVGRAF